MEPVVIVGAANDGELVVDLIEDLNEVKPSFEILGFLDDDPDKQGTRVNRYPVLGPLAARDRLPPRSRFVITVASAARTHLTKQITRQLALSERDLVTIVHPSATVSRSAMIGVGCLILAGVRINSRVSLGTCVTVEGNVWLGVGTRVGDYAVVTHDASVSGDCVLDEGCYLGSNCSVIERTRIGAWAVVGMGTVVLRDVPDRAVVVGNPARQVGTVEPLGAR